MYFLCDKFFELIIVVAGVWIGYWLSNKQISEQIKKENEASQKTELSIYKDKFVFNSLIEFRDNLQEHNGYVTNFFMNSGKYTGDDFLREPDLVDELKKTLDIDAKKINRTHRKLQNDLIFLSDKFINVKFEEEYEKARIFYDTLNIAVYDYYFSTSDHGSLEAVLESTDFKINYNFMSVFTEQSAANLKRTPQEIYQEESEEIKEFVKNCSEKLQDNPDQFIAEIYVEHFQTMSNLLDIVSETMEKQFNQLGE